MTYISRKTRLLVPRWFDECDPAYLYHLNRKRSDGRLKRHGSCDDLRAWVDDQYLNYQYLLELVTDGEIQGRPFPRIMGRIIPVENILDVICGNALYDGNGCDEIVGSTLGKPGRKPREVKESDEKVNVVTADAVLKVTMAAMSKLETISNLIYSTSDSEKSRPCDEKNDLNMQLSGDMQKSEEELSENTINREEYLTEYNKTLSRISCLRQKVEAINQRRKELQAKVQSPCQTVCRSSSGMNIMELYSRENQMYAKRIQKRIVRLIQEKGQTLNEMCEAMKYLNELKKKLDSGAEFSTLSNPKSEFSPEKEYVKKLEKYSRVNENNEDKPNKEGNRSVTSFGRRKKRDVENSDLVIDLRMGCSQENLAAKHSQHKMNDSETINPNDMKKDIDSSDAALTSLALLPESQKTELIPEIFGDRKSKSELTVNDLEKILRGYEERLRDLECIEAQIEELKKRASVANYYKKRWLRCTTRDRFQKTAERKRTKEELKHLYYENNELKKLVVKLTAKSEKEQNEIQYLKCKHKQMSEMEEEIMELKKDLKGYQISFETQRECIDSLENTVTVQRDRIENLMTHIRRLSAVTEKVKETRKTPMRYSPRSRSHGPENKKNLKKTTVASSEESLQNSFCCNCCSCSHHSEVPNRPRSACARRMILVPQTWRRQSCNN